MTNMKLNVKDFLFGIYITTLGEFVYLTVFGTFVRILLAIVALYSLWIFIDLKKGGDNYL